MAIMSILGGGRIINKKIRRLPGWSVGARLLLINGLLMVALVVVTVIAWRALSAQSRAMAELALISKAARYHQDADTVHANLRADVSAALASAALSADERAAIAASLADNARVFRQDLMTLENINVTSDVVETETKAHVLADIFLASAMEAGPLALRDAKAAEALARKISARTCTLVSVSTTSEVTLMFSSVIRSWRKTLALSANEAAIAARSSAESAALARAALTSARRLAWTVSAS